jgi:AAA+ superfamily predicted ATPase
MSKKTGVYGSDIEYVRDRIDLLELMLAGNREQAKEMRQVIDEKKKGRNFALDSFIHEFALDEIEENILFILLKYDLEPEDEAFGKDVIGEVSKLCGIDPLEARRYLYSDSKLLINGIVSTDDEGSTVLSSIYSLNEWVIRRMLGQEKDSWDSLVVEEERYEPVERKSEIFRAIEPSVGMGEVVLNGSTRDRINEALAQIRYHSRIFDEWGAKDKFPSSLTFLFYGPPGTGKTYTAEALAKEMGKKLFMVNYPKLISMWLGNTEKNVERAFKEAKENDAVLLFDEADAMLRDRSFMFYNGLYESVNVLLSELDRFDGVIIFTTNQATLLDKALDRRVSMKIPFDPPEEKEREALWDLYLPKSLPTDADKKELARGFNLTGAQIRNAVMSAMRKGAPKGYVSQSDFVKACEEEITGVKNRKSGAQYL